MVTTIGDAVELVTEICKLPGSADFVAASRVHAKQSGLVKAVRTHDTPALYGWQMESFSFQAISDRIAWGYIEAHGNRLTIRYLNAVAFRANSSALRRPTRCASGVCCEKERAAFSSL